MKPITKEILIDHYLINNLSAQKIADIYCVSQPTILNWFKKFNIPRKSISQALKGRELSIDHKEKISKTTKGITPKNINQLIESGKKTRLKSGNEHINFGKNLSEEIKIIQDAIAAINNDDTNQAKKLLIQVEGMMEDMPDKTAEKRVEAAIKMVKDGNKDSALMHANEAIKLLQP